METSSVGRERFVRIVKGIAIVAIVVFVIAVVVNVVSVNNRSGGMLQSVNTMQGLSNGGRVQKNIAAPSMGYSGSASVPSSDMMAASNESESVATNESTASVEKKVIKKGNLALKVESVEKAMDDLRHIAAQVGGDIFSSSIYDTTNTSRGVKQGNVTLKVPAAHFDEALQNIRSIARVVISETTNGQDVTSQYVDLQARLKNKQAEEESIAAILTRDTNRIDEILQVTMQLSRVRGEIEQLQAQMKYLDNQSEMSTIEVSFTEDVQIGETKSVWRPTQEIKSAVNTLIKAGQQVISLLISFIIVIVPIFAVLILIFGGILYVIVKKVYRMLNR